MTIITPKNWTALKSSFEGRNSTIKFTKPQLRCWMDFAVGHSGFGIHTWMSKEKRYICVGLVKSPDAKSRFQRLRQNKAEIESEVGAELSWEDNPKRCNIRHYRRDTDVENRQDWDRQHQWIYEQLEIFYRVFGPRVQAL